VDGADGHTVAGFEAVTKWGVLDIFGLIIILYNSDYL
jgi:hypothetical protein